MCALKPRTSGPNEFKFSGGTPVNHINISAWPHLFLWTFRAKKDKNGAMELGVGFPPSSFPLQTGQKREQLKNHGTSHYKDNWHFQ